MTNSTPQAKYQDKLAAGDFLEDAAQAQVVALLDDLYQRLANREQPSGLSALIGKLRNQCPMPEQGL